MTSQHLAAMIIDKALFPGLTFIAGVAVKGFFDNSFKESLARFEAKLKRYETRDEAGRDQLSSIYKTLVERSTNRGSLAASKKLEAVEQAWSAVCEMRPVRNLGSLAVAIKLDDLLDGAAKQTGEGADLRRFASTLLSLNPEAEKLMKRPDRVSIEKVQIYLDASIVEALTIYRTAVTYPYIVLSLAGTGIESKGLKKDVVTAGVKKLLPIYADYVDRYGVEVIGHLYDQLEQKILAMLKEELGANPAMDVAELLKLDEPMKIYQDATAFSAADVPKSVANNSPTPLM